jgi:hypothetical protein
MFGLQCDFNPRMAEGPIRSVFVLPALSTSVVSADRPTQVPEHCVMPVGSCTQNLYVKKTCHSTLSFTNFVRY